MPYLNDASPAMISTPPSSATLGGFPHPQSSEFGNPSSNADSHPEEDPDRMHVDYESAQPVQPLSPSVAPRRDAFAGGETSAYRPPLTELGGYGFPLSHPMTRFPWSAQPVQQPPAPMAAQASALPAHAPRMRPLSLDLPAPPPRPEMPSLPSMQPTAYARMDEHAAAVAPPEGMPPPAALPAIQPAVRARIAVVISLPGPEGLREHRSRQRSRPVDPFSAHLPTVLRLRYAEEPLPFPAAQTDVHRRRRQQQRRRQLASQHAQRVKM